MWRALETGPRQVLNGHEGGNPGHKPRMSLRATAPVLDPTSFERHVVEAWIDHAANRAFSNISSMLDFNRNTHFCSTLLPVLIFFNAGSSGKHPTVDLAYRLTSHAHTGHQRRFAEF